jgi:homoserine kinase type II
MYTTVDEAQVQDLLTRMKAGRIERITVLAGGLANSNYRIDRIDAPPLVLKVCDERDVAAARRVAANAVWLQQHNVPTPAPLPGPDGDWITVVDGRAWMVQPFVPGHWIRPTAEALFQLGQALAHLHATPIPPDISKSFAMGFTLFEEIVAKADNQNFDHPFVERLRTSLRSLRPQLPDDVPRGIVHGDLFPSNALAENEKLVAILDWEEICHERLVLDLAMTVVGHGWHDGKPVPERWHALRKGYESIRKLTPTEKATLPLFHEYATLSIAGWRFGQFVLDEPDKAPEYGYEEMALRLDVPYPFD